MTETERGQFTFYASFAAALRRLRDPAERCTAYDAIIDYALRGAGNGRGIRRKAAGKQEPSKTQAAPKQERDRERDGE